MSAEITVKINSDKKTVISLFKKAGYNITRQWTQISTYWTHLNITETVDYKTLITNSILIRQEEKSPTLIYKNKQFDNKGNVIAEEQTKQYIQSTKTANKIFKLAGFKNWVTMTAEQMIFTKGKNEFCIQDVENLGLYLEAENRNGETLEELISFAKKLNLPLDNDFVGVKLPYLVYLKKTHFYQ